MNNDTLPISKEGWNYVGYSIAIFIFFVILHLNILSFIALAFIVFFTFLYRNPERESISFMENSVVSPVDGRVVYIENLIDSEYSYRVEIDTRCSNIGFLRSPMNAKVIDLEVIKGTKLPISSELFAKLNENTTLIFEDEASHKIKIQHFSKVSFDDIKIDIVQNQNLTLSSRYGFMLNGLTSIYLPKDFQIDVRAGTQLFASITPIGSFK